MAIIHDNRIFTKKKMRKNVKNEIKIHFWWFGICIDKLLLVNAMQSKKV